ncbi:hypothetical protein KCP78_08170 [Salmonella enterica subsp. enterica]|nr:hypothetical protein KCP78_08170 [Salmonella enterica subsp. enterica]
MARSSPPGNRFSAAHTCDITLGYVLRLFAVVHDWSEGKPANTLINSC